MCNVKITTKRYIFIYQDDYVDFNIDWAFASFVAIFFLKGYKVKDIYTFQNTTEKKNRTIKDIIFNK